MEIFMNFHFSLGCQPVKKHNVLNLMDQIFMKLAKINIEKMNFHAEV